MPSLQRNHRTRRRRSRHRSQPLRPPRHAPEHGTNRTHHHPVGAIFEARRWSLPPAGTTYEKTPAPFTRSRGSFRR
ncbi:hypothetical protein ACFPRL_27300 [Pseudoclavibacter helvolus]